MRAKREMIRFVVGPEDLVVPDLAGKLPGRGLWVTASREKIMLAAQKNFFAKAAKAKAVVPPLLAEQVDALLARSVLNLIGLSRRAGAIIAGYEKVRELLAQPVTAQGISAILEASDGAEDGRKSILFKAKAMALPAVVIGCFSTKDLSVALGLEHVIHAALAPRRADANGLATRVLDEIFRLSGFRPLIPEGWQPMRTVEQA